MLKKLVGGSPNLQFTQALRLTRAMWQYDDVSARQLQCLWLLSTPMYCTHFGLDSRPHSYTNPASPPAVAGPDLPHLNNALLLLPASAASSLSLTPLLWCPILTWA